jgi:penicillin-binding protein 1C
MNRLRPARGALKGVAVGAAAGVAAIAAAIAMAGVVLVRDASSLRPPTFSAVRTAWTPSYAYLLARDGEVIEANRVDFRRLRSAWVRLDDISAAMRTTVVQVEDRRFASHHGVDWRALPAAAWQTLRGHGVRGASTITMQLAALVTPVDAGHAGRRGLGDKLRQMRAAWQLERDWSKEEILEAYLNLVSFRGELQGIDAASQTLFGKAPSGLTAAEALLLASMIAMPNATSQRLAARACALETRRAPDVRCDDVERAALSLDQRPSRIVVPSLAPHLARGLLDTPGQRIRTTLDASLQRDVAAILERQLATLAGYNVRDGAAVVLDNATGEVLAYVGSSGTGSSAAAVDGARARRQAGSTLKPFLYGLAFERRYLTPVSVLDDSPLNLETGTGLYVPQNYDRQFAGLVSARTALASSLNIPAVRTLILVGVEAFRDRLQSLGYEAVDQDGAWYGYSLALGSGEVTLLQQANAYRTLANGGLWSPVHVQPGIDAHLSSVAAPAVAGERRVMPESVAYLVTDILSDPAARAQTFGLDSTLETPFWSAVKTGTSKDMRDNWCIGYSRRYTAAVWVGNFEGDSMIDVSGVTGAAPAWHEIMVRLHEGVPSHAPAVPAGLVARDVRFEPAIEPSRRSWFLEGTEVDRVSVLTHDTGRARIASPANGTIIALDPDIPAANQRVVVESRGADAGLAFYLNGQRLGSSERPRAWSPVPGAHELELRSADGRVRDSVRFVVRGGAG